jgi:ribosome-binding protein aMBF1 (putative translation factor)
MKSSSDIKAKFKSLIAHDSVESEIDHDAHILMAGFLSEIERIQKQKNISRKSLAERINTSASYLTQVFRGDKPLNFVTLAKIQKTLEIRFEIHARYKREKVERPAAKSKPGVRS